MRKCYWLFLVALAVSDPLSAVTLTVALENVAERTQVSQTGDYVRLSASGAESLGVPGAPDWPAFSLEVPIPQSIETPVLTVTAGLWVPLCEGKPWPIQTPTPVGEPEAPFTLPDSAAYAAQTPWADVGPVYLAAPGRRAVRILAKPYRFRDGHIECADLTFTLSYNDHPRLMAENERDPKGYLILTTRHFRDSGLWNDFAAYRASEVGGGYSVRIATLQDDVLPRTGETGVLNKMKAFIRESGCQYVLLGGIYRTNLDDYLEYYPEDNIPTFVSESLSASNYIRTIPSDQWFACAEGSFAPDIAVGRLPVPDSLMVSDPVTVNGSQTRTAEQIVEGYLSKLRRSEATQFPGEGRVTLLAQDLWSNGNDFRPAERHDLVDGLPAYADTARLPKSTDAFAAMRGHYAADILPRYAVAPGGFWMHSDSANSEGLGDNASLTRWTSGRDAALLGVYAHGSPTAAGYLATFYAGTIGTHHMTSLFRVATAISCDSGDYTYTFGYGRSLCVAESLVCNPVGGATVAIFNSALGWGPIGGTSWQYDNAFVERLLTAIDGTTVGECYRQAKAVYAANAQNNVYHKWVQYAWNYFGDPALMFRTRRPQPYFWHGGVARVSDAAWSHDNAQTDSLVYVPGGAGVTFAAGGTLTIDAPISEPTLTVNAPLTLTAPKTPTERTVVNTETLVLAAALSAEVPLYISKGLVGRGQLTLDGAALTLSRNCGGTGMFPDTSIEVRNGGILTVATDGVTGWSVSNVPLTIGPAGTLRFEKRDTLRRGVLLSGGMLTVSERSQDRSLDLFQGCPITVTADSTIKSLDGVSDALIYVRGNTSISFSGGATLTCSVNLTGKVGADVAGMLTLTGDGTFAFDAAMDPSPPPVAVRGSVRLKGGTYANVIFSDGTGIVCSPNTPLTVTEAFTPPSTGKINITGQGAFLTVPEQQAATDYSVYFQIPAGRELIRSADGRTYALSSPGYRLRLR